MSIPLKLLSILFLLFSLTVFAAEQIGHERDYRLKSLYWQPYVDDPDTLGLYKMNKADSNDLHSLGDLAVDSSRTQKPLTISGPFKYIKEGFFANGLLIHGEDSVLESAEYHLGPGLTVEGWFQPQKLDGTLICLTDSSGTTPLLSLRLKNNGNIVLYVENSQKGVAKSQLKCNNWFHVAVCVKVRKVYAAGGLVLNKILPEKLVVYVNGRPVIRYKDDAFIKSLRKIGRKIYFGNMPDKKSPFNGTVDELRISRVPRDYYSLDRRYVDHESSRELQNGSPYFQAQQDLLFDLPFDYSLKPHIGDEEFQVKATSEETTVFEDGVRGKGIVVGENLKAPSVEFPEDISVNEGCIEFWFRPDNWDNNMPRKSGKQDLAPLGCMFYAIPGKKREKQFFSLYANRFVPESKWGGKIEPGHWYHILLTWKKKNFKLYLNGTLADPSLFTLNISPSIPDDGLITKMEVGQCYNYLYGKLARTPEREKSFFDDLRFYCRALSRVEVENAFKRYNPKAELTKLPFAEVAFKPNAALRKVEIELSVLNENRDAVDSVEFTLMNDKGRKIFRNEAIYLNDFYSKDEYFNWRLTYGSYTVIFTFKDVNGNVIAVQNEHFEYPAPEWYGNRLGIHSGKVPPPWTPLTMEDNNVSTALQNIVFDHRGWPMSIFVKGKKIFDGPVIVRLETDKGKIALNRTQNELDVLKKRDDIVITEGNSVGKEWRLKTKVETEFDGFMKVKLSLAGPPGAVIKKFSIDLPLNLNREQFVGFWTGQKFLRLACDYRKLPDSQGRIFASNDTGKKHLPKWQDKCSFLPYLSICDDQTGFCWMAENDKNWTQSWSVPAIEVIKDYDLTIMRLNIISQAKKIQRPIKFTFAMQVTPSKPVSDINVSDVNMSHIDAYSGVNLKHDSTDIEYRLIPKNMNWDNVCARYLEFKKTYKTKPVLYLNKLWQRTPDTAVEFKPFWRGWGSAVRYTRNVQDCYLFYVNEWLRRGFIKGVYIDDAWIQPSQHTQHLLAYKKKNNNVEWGFEIFDYRKFLKRLYWLFIDNQLKPQILVNATHLPFVPMLAFANAFFDGNERIPENKNFLSFYGLERLRYANPQKWAMPMVWLSNSFTLTAKDQEQTCAEQRAYLAGVMLNNLSVTRQDENSLKLPEWLGQKMQFLGYWETDNPVVALTNHCNASVYYNKKQAVLVFVNSSDEVKLAEFSLDLTKIKKWLGVADIKLEDIDNHTGRQKEPLAAQAAEEINLDVIKKEVEKGDNSDDIPDSFYNNHNFNLKNGKLTLKINPHDFRLIQIRVQ